MIKSQKNVAQVYRLFEPIKRKSYFHFILGVFSRFYAGLDIKRLFQEYRTLENAEFHIDGINRSLTKIGEGLSLWMQLSIHLSSSVEGYVDIQEVTNEEILQTQQATTRVTSDNSSSLTYVSKPFGISYLCWVTWKF